MRNNLFIVLEGGETAMMAMPPSAQDFYNNIFSPTAPWGAEYDVAAVKDPGLLDDCHLAPDSPAIDAGCSKVWQVWTDFAGNTVPCGQAPDAGAFEYCPK